MAAGWLIPVGPVSAAETVKAAPTTEVALDEAAARRAAASSGRAVEVTTERTSDRTVTVQPDGTLTEEISTQPQRLWRNGAWVEPDASLVRGPARWFVPKAAEIDLRVSEGGVGPFVEFRRAGRVVGVSWPTPLPVPRVVGDRAIYSEVRPGVDLVVTADVTKFTHVLVVKNKNAAADLATAGISYGLHLDGVRLARGDEDAIEYVDVVTGGVVFEAPPPQMWDAGTAEDQADADLLDSPNDSSRVAAIDWALDDAGHLRLTPDSEIVNGSVWPVVIDPATGSTGRSEWLMVDSAFPGEPKKNNAFYWKFKGDQGMGLCPRKAVTCNSSKVKRVFFAYPMSYRGLPIKSAKMSLIVSKVQDSATGFYVQRIKGGISSSSNWKKLKDTLTGEKTSVGAGVREVQCKKGAAANVAVDVTRAVKATASARKQTPRVTFAVAANDEGKDKYYKRICSSSTITYTYNRPPDTPGAGDVFATSAGACVSGDHRPAVRELPTLTAMLRDPDASNGHAESLWGRFTVGYTAGAATGSWEREIGPLASGTPFRLNTAVDAEMKTIPDGAVVRYSVRGRDGANELGGASPTCEFVYDKSAPQAARVSSELFLPRGAGSELACPDPDPVGNPRAAVGSYDTFRLVTAGKDTKEFRYDFDRGVDPRLKVPAVAGVGEIRSWQALRPGWHTLTVVAVDGAGNAAGSVACVFPVSFRGPVSDWAMNEAPGVDQVGDATTRLPLRLAAGAVAGEPGPGCRISGCTTNRAVRLSGGDSSYLAGSVADSVNGAESFSVSAWAWRDEASGNRSLFSVDGARAGQFWIGVSGGKWAFTAADSDAPNAAVTTAASGVDAVAKRWVHLTAVFDKHRKTMQLFIDGKPEPAVTRSAAGWVSPGAVQVGRRKLGDGYGESWKGLVADVALYDRVVVAPEAAAFSTRAATRQGYWQFSQASGAAGKQTSPEQRGGAAMALGGGARVTDAVSAGILPLVGPGFLGGLNGVDGHAVAAKSPIAISGSFTVAARVRLSSSGCSDKGPMTVLSQTGANNDAFTVRCRRTEDGDRWEAVLSAADTKGAPEMVLMSRMFVQGSFDGEHLAVVLDGASRQLTMYVDGVSVGVLQTPADFNPWNGETGLHVGRSKLAGGFGQHLVGEVDDLRVYSGVADAATVGRMKEPFEQPDL